MKMKSRRIKVVLKRAGNRSARRQHLSKLINDPPLLVSVQDAMALVGYGRSKIFKMLADGSLQRVKSGKSTRITMKSIMAFVEGK